MCVSGTQHVETKNKTAQCLASFSFYSQRIFSVGFNQEIVPPCRKGFLVEGGLGKTYSGKSLKF